MGDLGRGLRRLLVEPVGTLTIVGTLALGIGAPTAIASVVRGVLLRPLPFPDQERLVMLWQQAPGVGVGRDWLSTAQYFDLRERVTSFEETALVFGREVTLTGDDGAPERLGALEVSTSFFPLLGLRPQLGQALDAGDDAPNAPLRALLTRGLFERRFGGDPDILGRSITLDGRRVEVIGVLPPLPLDAEVFPTLFTVPLFEIVTSLPVEDPQRTTHGSENYNVLARLQPGAAGMRLETELLDAAELFASDPESLGAGLSAGDEYRLEAVPLLEQVVGGARSPLIVLLGATLLLLLVACANAANLLLTRTATRRRELAIRAALGADRGRLLRRSLAESLLLASAGGLLGLALAAAGVAALSSLAPPELPRLAEVRIDPAVLLFAAAAVLAATLIAGLAPASRAGRTAPIEALRSTGAAVSAGSAWRGSPGLVLTQLALSLVLTTGGVLLARSFAALQATDPGFRAESVMTFRLSPAGERYAEAGERRRFFREIFERIRSLPGADAAGGVSMLPMTRGFAWTDFLVEGFEGVDGRDRVVADVFVATPGYFEAMGVRLAAGRGLLPEDDGDPPAVIVGASFARRFWGEREAVGHWLGRTPEERSTIVGVVDDVRQYGLGAEPRLAVFYPHAARATRTLYAAVRGRGDPAALLPAIDDVVRSADPDLPIYDVAAMPDRVRASLARERSIATLLNLFAAVAVVLAAVGLYGVLAFGVASQTREIGVRRALGARRTELYALVLGRAGRLAAGGIGLGLAVALFAARLLDSLVYGVATTDPVSFAGAALLVTGVCLGVSLLPARRATRVDPIQALRVE